jgi:pimeloyl-ACP methyl ester carboxylesterase
LRDGRRVKRALRVVVPLLAAAVLGIAWQQLPGIGAGALLHPSRRAVTRAAPAGCVERNFGGAGVTLHGWQCEPSAAARATIVYLHGIADNRESATGVIARFLPRGFRVVAYDSRAHGQSDGDVCTYGFYEKTDLRGVIDAQPAGPVVLIGTSLGAAVALQEAADDPRIATIVAAETFSDLRIVASERAPLFFTRGRIDRAFALAEAQGRFRVDAVSPVDAAARIHAPVLLIHGAADVDTPPAHSQRVRAALRGRSELILVPGARHNESLNGPDVWTRIDEWIDGTGRRPASFTTTRLPSSIAGTSNNPLNPASVAGSMRKLKGGSVALRLSSRARRVATEVSR